MLMRSMQMRYDVMRVLCMFDLPVDTDKEKREYRNFKKKLILEGFVMLQYSVYIRTCPNRQYSERLQKRLAKNLPANGNIIFHKQAAPLYRSISYFLCSISFSELH